MFLSIRDTCIYYDLSCTEFVCLECWPGYLDFDKIIGDISFNNNVLLEHGGQPHVPPLAVLHT